MSSRDQRKAAKRRTKRKAEKRDAVERTGPSVSMGDVAAEYAETLADEVAGPELDTDVDLEDRFG